MFKVFSTVAASLLLTADARDLKSQVNASVRAPPLVDGSTYGNTDQIHTTHVHLDLKVDFDASTLSGSATHTMEVLETTSIAQFDVWDLTISQVYIGTDDDEAEVTSEVITNPRIDTEPNFSDVLLVTLDQEYKAGDIVTIKIDYTTSKEGQAFSWLTPAQTSGKVLSYMFTQCEDINCRSVAPLQDTPSNRITYSAKMNVLSEYVVKMSANETQAVEVVGDGTSNSYFDCSIPIPSYLIAAAIGDLEYKSLGERVGVITEPSDMDKCASELEDMGDLLDAVEAYMGPYIWGNYTIIVLPPSFPMGGMENPLLTFMSPTVIVGDKSQVYVATHEMAHSWTGNEVTCQNWESFWLNEGFTVFVERHVSAEFHGEDFSMVSALLGNTSMWQDQETYGLDNSFSSLHPVLKGANPDSSFSEVPYEKGYQLLYFLQSLISKPQMQNFLNFYMQQNSLTSITIVQMRETWEFFVEHKIGGLTPEQVNEILAAVNWNEWLFETGLAPVRLDFDTYESDQAAQLAIDYISLAGASSPTDAAEIYQSYYSNLKVVFHDTLQANADLLTLEILTQIDADLDCTNTIDPEVKQRWFPTGLTLQYTPVYTPAQTWISSMGRSKYLSPVYDSLQKSGQHDLACTWNSENIDFYHPVAETTIVQIIGSCDSDIVMDPTESESEYMDNFIFQN